MKFPKQIAVEWDDPDDRESILIGHRHPEDVADFDKGSVKVGLYRLERIVTVTAKAEVK